MYGYDDCGCVDVCKLVRRLCCFDLGQGILDIILQLLSAALPGPGSAGSYSGRPAERSVRVWSSYIESIVSY